MTNCHVDDSEDVRVIIIKLTKDVPRRNINHSPLLLWTVNYSQIVMVRDTIYEMYLID